MIKIYGSHFCSQTRECRYNFDRFKIAYEFHDISGSLKELKEFLKYRDTNSCFHRVKEVGGIGIPLIVDDEVITLNWSKFLIEKGFKDIKSYNEECIDENC